MSDTMARTKCPKCSRLVLIDHILPTPADLEANPAAPGSYLIRPHRPARGSMPGVSRRENRKTKCDGVPPPVEVTK